MTLRHYNNGEAEFILEPVNESVVKVTHPQPGGMDRHQPGLGSPTTLHDYHLLTSTEGRRHRTNRIGVRHPRRRNEVPVLVAAAPAEKGGLPESEP